MVFSIVMYTPKSVGKSEFSPVIFFFLYFSVDAHVPGQGHTFVWQVLFYPIFMSKYGTLTLDVLICVSGVV